MPFALGQRLLFHQLFRGGGVVLIVALVAIVLLIRLWPAIVRYWESRRR